MADWLKTERSDAATDRILDAAGEAFCDQGVRAATMGDIARHAGCSRATLYRYFANRDELDVAYVNRAALRIARLITESTASIDDVGERVVEAVLLAVTSVRDDPQLAVWFTEADMGIATRFGTGSEVLDALGEAFAGRLVDDIAPDDLRRRSRWIVRVIVSLLMMPGESEDEERAMLREFVASPLAAIPDTTTP